MNRKYITAACLTLFLAGCGDKNDSATGNTEQGMMDKAMDSGSELVGGAGNMATDTAGAVTETADDNAEGTSEMASDAVNTTSKAIHPATQGVADTTATEAEDTETKEALELQTDGIETKDALDYMDKEMGEISESLGQ